MGVQLLRRTMIVSAVLVVVLGVCIAEDAPLLRRRNRSFSASGEDHDSNPNWDNNPYWEIISRTSTANAAIRDSDASYGFDTTATDFDNTSGADSERAFSTNSASETAFVQKCLGVLETHASENDLVSREDYVHFLSDISKGTLKAQTFHDLPLFLSMIFFSASCSHGEDCVTQAPALTIHRSLTKGEQDMNAVMCHQLMRFPFLEILFPFQFLIRVSSEFSAEDFLVKSGSEKLVPNLEFALDTALLEGFNCTFGPDDSVAVSRQQTKPRGRKQQIDISGSRQPQPQDDCNFIVDVTIADAADYRKW